MKRSFNNMSVFTVMMLALAGTVTWLTGCGEDHRHGEHRQAAPAAHRHAQPGETCFICDASKRDAGRLWCREHGRYEDRCWLCHPELEDKDRPYCSEHYLYEDECFLCEPSLKPEAEQSAAGPRPRQAMAGDLFCHEHGVAEVDCAICQPDLASMLEPGSSMKIRFPSPAAADKAGIATGRATVSQSAPSIEALCEAQYNRNVMARVTPLAGGVIRAVHHDVGEQVAAGDVLVELHAPRVADARSAFLSALVERDSRKQTYEREQLLKERGIAAARDFLEAQAAWRAADLAVANHRQNLVNLGFTADDIEQIAQTQDTSATLVVRAPFAGTLIERNAVIGEAVDVGDPLFTLADLSTRWLMLSIPSAHVDQVHPGQVVHARFRELPEQIIEGTITWVDTSVDPRSRMVRARAVVERDVDRIRTGLFGRARILLDHVRPITSVPRQAVQQQGSQAFVFIQREPDLFDLRRVALGAVDGDRVEVLAGLEPTEMIVTQGSFIVMSEFQKFRLGAGCADH